MSLEEEAEPRPEDHSDVAPPNTGRAWSPRAVLRGALGRLSRDEIVHQDICAALLASHGLDAHHIDVEMTNEGIILRGMVATEHDRSRALEIAAKLAGTRVVRDALAVSRRGPADAECARAALSREPHRAQTAAQELERRLDGTAGRR